MFQNAAQHHNVLLSGNVHPNCSPQAQGLKHALAQGGFICMPASWHRMADAECCNQLSSCSAQCCATTTPLAMHCSQSCNQPADRVAACQPRLMPRLTARNCWRKRYAKLRLLQRPQSSHPVCLCLLLGRMLLGARHCSFDALTQAAGQYTQACEERKVRVVRSRTQAMQGS